jgi:membrane fusion protein (multidrug efflux system)
MLTVADSLQGWFVSAVPLTVRLRALVLPIGLATLTLSACEQSTPVTTTSLPEVTTITAAPTSLSLSLNYSGHTAGSRQVEVRSRVSGILLSRKFEEGKPVAQGQILFELDPEPAQAALAQAQAELAMQRAQAAQAKRELDRVLAMASQGLVSQLQRDQAQSAAEIANANRLAAEARLRKAELDLSYTHVRAPIGGLASNEARSEGSLVTAGTESSLLTRIVQADPLYVEFTVPDSEAAILRSALAQSQLSPQANKVTARIELADGSQYPEVAQLTFLDNAVEVQSGSIAARAIVHNPNRVLLPGQFVRVRVDGLQIADVIGVPRKAVLTNSEGYFVWVLDDKDAVNARQITLGVNVGDRVVVKSGLQPGDRIVVDGIMKVAAGDRVNVVTRGLAGSSSNEKPGSGLIKSIE